MATTTTTTTTTTQYGMSSGAQFGASGSVMGVTEAAHDEAVDVTYSTKPDAAGGVTTLNAMTTSTTAQPYTTTKVLKPIYNNTVKPAIVSNTVLNPMINNFQPEVRNSM